ncbi:DUF6809 domain-containing protein, partial [Dysosmobacter welbionis]
SAWSRATLNSPIRRQSMWTEVSSGSSIPQAELSSSPVTARSSGTRRPRRRAAFMAPAAITSFPPKMAVGRSCRDSSSRQASAALS